MQTDFQKRHQSLGKYEHLVHLGKQAFGEGHVASVEAGVEAACHAHPALAQLVCDGPKDVRNWTYCPVVKRCMNYTDPLDAEGAHKNIIRKALPAYWDAERRGYLMQPATSAVTKASPGGQAVAATSTFDQVLAMAEERVARMGRVATKAELLDMATAIFRENPALYEQHVREQLAR